MVANFPHPSYSASRAAVRACRSPAFPMPLNKTRHALRLPSPLAPHLPSPFSPVYLPCVSHPRAPLSYPPSLPPVTPLSPIRLHSRLSLSPINKIAHLPRKLIARLNFSRRTPADFFDRERPSFRPFVSSSLFSARPRTIPWCSTTRV